MVTDDGSEVTAVPADLSTRSLTGWVSLIRVTALGLQPKSPARDAFLVLAVKNVNYAAFLLRTSKARADYLKGEALKLPSLRTTVADWPVALALGGLPEELVEALELGPEE